MSLLRKKSIEQMKKLYSETKSTDIGAKTQHMWNGSPNLQYCNNPFDGKRKQDNIDDIMHLEIKKFSQFSEEINEKKEMSIEDKIDFITNVVELDVAEKSGIIIQYCDDLLENMEEEIKFNQDFSERLHAIKEEFGKKEINKIYKMAQESIEESINENVDGNVIVDYAAIINRDINKIINWTNFNQHLRERPVGGEAGKQINVGEDSGYIQRIIGNNVHIQMNSDGKEKIVPLKELFKNYKIKKDKKTQLFNITLNGPDDTSVASAPKEDKNPVVPKVLDEVSKKDKMSRKDDPQVLKFKSFNEK